MSQPQRQSQAQSPDDAAASPWDEFRRRMPVSEKWAYFDHAAVAPISGPAAEAIRQWAQSAATDGEVHWAAWNRRLEEVRRLSARLFGAAADEIALVRNTTEGIGLVAEGYPWQQGDNVVLFEREFPSNLYPWMNLQSRGVDVRWVPTDNERVQLEDVERLCDGRTRIVSVSWVGYATGWRNDLDRLAEIAHRHGALLFVDAIQGLGVTPLDVGRTPIDFFAADGHKWLLGPEGAGLLFVRREHLDRLRPLGVGWNSVQHAGDYGRIELKLKNSASRYEGGSHNMAGFLGLAASLELLAEFGIENVHRRILDVGDQVCRRLESLGGSIASDRRPQHASGIIACEFAGSDPQRLREHCGRQGVVVNCRGGRLRISPHAYTNQTDVERLVEALAGAIG